MQMSFCRSASSLVVGTNYGGCCCHRHRHPLCPLQLQLQLYYCFPSTACRVLQGANSPYSSNMISFSCRSRKKRGTSQVLIQASKSAENSNQAYKSSVKEKIAHLTGRSKQRVILTNHINDNGKSFRKLHPMSEFLSHSSGAAETSVFNRKSYQSVQHLDSAGSNNTYRCTLHAIQLLNFKITPICDIRVIPTPKDCTVEMFSCKFEGSQDNDRFSASMRNHITWDENDSEPYLDVEFILTVSLQMDRLPFALLPVSAVEIPGNLTMQALVDNLARQLIQELLKNYEKWLLSLQCEVSTTAVEQD